MTIGEKITILRKQKNLSQEDLASLLNVSRQSVSKWELSDSMPDLDKILNMADLFQVSVDELVRDDLPLPSSESPAWLQNQQARDYIETAEKYNLPFALAVALCILSPICLLLFAAGYGEGFFHTIFAGEEQAAFAGLIILLIPVTIAAGIFIYCSSKTSKFEWMENEPVMISNDIRAQALAMKNRLEKRNTILLTAGIMTILLGVIVLFVTIMVNQRYVCFGLPALLVFVAAGVFMIIYSSNSSKVWNVLLEQEDYTPDKKAFQRKYSWLPGTYWCVITAVYLVISFLSEKWDLTWIIMMAAGIIYGALIIFLNSRMENRS